MINITCHQGNARQKNNEIITSHLKNWLSSKRQQITSISEDVENPHAFSWECSLVQPLWKTVQRFLKKLKIELPYDAGITLGGIFLKETKTRIQKDIHTRMFMAVLLTIAKTWKPPECPSIDEWIKFSHIYIHIYTHNGI